MRVLKYAVPGLAGLGVVLFLFFALFDPFRVKDVDVDVGTVSVSGDMLTMELPRLTGFNSRQQSYNVTARTAQQRITAPGLIELTDLEAIISMPDKDTATLTASAGQFDSGKEFLTLREKVRVSSTKGYAADLSTATVDFKAGVVKSDEPVEVTLEAGRVRAGALLVQGGGEVITFTGGVSTTFQTRTDDAPGAAAAGPGPERQGSIQ